MLAHQPLHPQEGRQQLVLVLDCLQRQRMDSVINKDCLQGVARAAGLGRAGAGLPGHGSHLDGLREPRGVRGQQPLHCG